MRIKMVEIKRRIERHDENNKNYYWMVFILLLLIL